MGRSFECYRTVLKGGVYMFSTFLGAYGPAVLTEERGQLKRCLRPRERNAVDQLVVLLHNDLTTVNTIYASY